MNFFAAICLFALLYVSCSENPKKDFENDSDSIVTPPPPETPPLDKRQALKLERWVTKLVGVDSTIKRFNAFFEKHSTGEVSIKSSDFSGKFAEITYFFATKFLSDNPLPVMLKFYEIIKNIEKYRYLLPGNFLESYEKHRAVLEAIKDVITKYDRFIKSLLTFTGYKDCYKVPALYEVMKFTSNCIDDQSLAVLLQCLEESKKFFQELSKIYSCKYNSRLCEVRRKFLTAAYERTRSNIDLCVKGKANRSNYPNEVPPPKLPPFIDFRSINGLYLKDFSAANELITKDVKKNFEERNDYKNIKFNVNKLLGSGSQAFVYKGTFVQSDKKNPVVMKLYTSKNAKMNCAKEFLYMKLLQNAPFICHAFSQIQYEGKPALIIEFAEKGDLFSRYISKNWTYDDVLKWMAQIVVGIQNMHGYGIIHRDLKLDNILLTGTDNVLISDFGLAKRFKTSYKSKFSRKCGTPIHIPPEIYNNEHADYETDIFALGLIFYHFITPNYKILDKLFRKHSELIKLANNFKLLATLSEYIARLPVRRDAPEGAEELFRGMVHPDPKKRYTLLDIMKSKYLKGVVWKEYNALTAPISKDSINIQ